ILNFVEEFQETLTVSSSMQTAENIINKLKKICE
ncbi:hypothetical protein ACJ72_08616, partial [Emergomyces africanus]